MSIRQDTSHDQDSTLDPEKKKELKILVAAILFCIFCEALYIVTVIIWPLQCVGQILVCGLGGIVLSFAEQELQDAIED